MEIWNVFFRCKNEIIRVFTRFVNNNFPCNTEYVNKTTNLCDEKEKQ